MFREHFTSLMRSFVQNEFKRSYVIGQVFRVGNFDICWCEMQREARLGHQNSPQLLNFRPTGRYRRIKRQCRSRFRIKRHKLAGISNFRGPRPLRVQISNRLIIRFSGCTTDSRHKNGTC